MGVILPDVDILEQRKYVDYFTFQAYDVVKDVEKEYDKGNYSTDLFGYIKDLGYDVQIGLMIDSMEKIMSSGGVSSSDYKMLINGQYAFVYTHTETMYKDLERDSWLMGEDASVLGSRIDTRDIKSIMIYDRPMLQSEAWSLSPLYMANSPYVVEDMMGTFKKYNAKDNMDISDFKEENNNKRDRIVYLVDVLLKSIDESSPRKDQFDRSRRFTTVDGYSIPFSFYSPEYPNGPIPGDVDYRRTLYWNPNVITDENGHARVEFYNNSYSAKFTISGAGITASGVPYILNQNW